MSEPSDYRNAFGFADAALATQGDIIEDHLIRDVESMLKWNARSQGRCIVVGIKGSGKTDLRRFIEETDRSKSLVLNLNCDTGYFNLQADQVKMRSGRIKNALALQLLGVFAEVIPNSGSKAQKAVGALREAASTVVEVGKKLGLATTVDLRFAEIDLSQLAATVHSGLVKDAWETMVRDIGSALSGKRGYILIDDVEDVFPGIEQNANFMEGLSRAVVEINQALGSKLHVLLFVKYGIWRYWFDNQREYDKVQSAIEMVSWTSAALVDLIARRIALRKGLDESDSDQQLWSAAFEFNDFDAFTAQFTSICVNGPRDIIELCNRCAEIARDDRITVDHLETIVPGYSEAKLNEVGADFGDVYPDVEKLARKVLRRASATMTAQALAKRFEEKVVDDEKLWEEFRKRTWFRMRGPDDFAALMYEVGIVGVQDGDNATYAIEVPQRTMMPNDLLVIHPAFRPFLAIS